MHETESNDDIHSIFITITELLWFKLHFNEFNNLKYLPGKKSFLLTVLIEWSKKKMYFKNISFNETAFRIVLNCLDFHWTELQIDR